LKAIFDEMFETRRYTKIIDAFWEQHKEYTKEIKETKKSMEYLKRLYDDDNRRKLKALRETEAVAKAAAQLPVMREKIKELEAKGDPAESMKRKYLLGQRRGALKEKLTTLNKNA
jgi:DNA repair exonuclease SbcCD ATPase subunit